MGYLKSKLHLLAWKAGLYSPPDRVMMESVILPYYGARQELKSVLFVGCQNYTKVYENFFQGKDYWTIEPREDRKRFGASQHVCDVIQNLGKHFKPQAFDLIMFNGVIGRGLNDLDQIEYALKTCSDHLKPGGEFLLGINEDFDASPNDRWKRELKFFSPKKLPPLDAHRVPVPLPFHDVTSHIYMFFEKGA